MTRKKLATMLTYSVQGNLSLQGEPTESKEECPNPKCKNRSVVTVKSLGGVTEYKVCQYCKHMWIG